MACNCSIVNFILAAVVFALAIGPGALLDETTSFWVIAVASAVLMIHTVLHRTSMSSEKTVVVAKKRRR